MTIKNTTTLGEMQLELHRIGADTMTWIIINGRHLVTLYGPYIPENTSGCGRTFLEAVDDAFTSATQAIGTELVRAD